MKESSTYQCTLEEGRVEGREQGLEQGRTEEAMKILLKIGEKRFGKPAGKTQAALEAISSHERLEKLIDRALEVETWEELLK